MVRRTALADEDVLDDRFFLYAEDKDLCRRVGRAGWRITFLPWARVVHYGGQSAAGASTQSFVWLQRSQLVFYHKHFSRPYALALSVTWWWAVLARYVAATVLWCLCPWWRARLTNTVLHFRAANAWLLRHLGQPERS
jgi:GT2 family glycosyltransferase